MTPSFTEKKLGVFMSSLRNSVFLITEIAAIEIDKVFLKLDKERVAQLPDVRIRRLWE